MNYGIDQALEPRVLRDQGDISEESRGANERASDRLESLDGFSRFEQLVRDRTFQMYVLEELLSRSCPTFAATISQDAYECLGEEPLRMLGEEQTAGDRQRAIFGQASSV